MAEKHYLYDTPALVATKTTMVMNGQGLRISFGEELPGCAPSFHTSVFLPFQSLGEFERAYKEIMQAYAKRTAQEKVE